jgi:cell division protein FtsB
MGPGETIALLIVVGLPMLMMILWTRHHFRYKEKQLEANSSLAAEKAAQYAASNAELEARVRVLEQIVTDRGVETAAQIEALRSPRLTNGDKVQ